MSLAYEHAISSDKLILCEEKTTKCQITNLNKMFILLLIQVE